MSESRWLSSQKVALFIDLPNQSGLDMEWIVNTALKYGKLEVAWGYGRFHHHNDGLSHMVEQLRRLGVRLIHCPDFGYGQNDMTDLYMMRDIYHTLVQRPEIDCFVVCTGDGDFADVITTVRAHGRKVVVIGPPDATSRQLARVADQCLIGPLSSPGSRISHVARQPCIGGQDSGGNGRSR